MRRLITGLLLALLAPSLVLAQSASLLPNGQQVFVDANGAPLAGGFVYMYSPGTTAPKTTWQDPNQLVPNSNPIVLNSAGRGIIFGSGQYRQVLQDLNGVTIWDQLTNSAGAETAPALTVRGNASAITAAIQNLTQVQLTALVNSFTSALKGLVPASGGGSAKYLKSDGTWGVLPQAPGGRLTLVSGSPVMTTSQSAKTAIFYSPYNGGLVALYDGTNFVNYSFSELTLSLDSNAAHTGYQQSGKVFDLFVTLNGSAVTLVSGPAWASTTSRGTGAGTSELQLVNGVWTNKNTLTTKFDTTASTLSVAANQATFLGSMFMTADGQTSFVFGSSAAGGGEAKLYLWNQYNRVPVGTTVSTSTITWGYTSAAWRQAEGSATFKINYLAGQPEIQPFARYSTATRANTAAANANAIAVGVALDSIITPTGIAVMVQDQTTSQNVLGVSGAFSGFPGLGVHSLLAAEYGGGVAQQAFFGTNQPNLGGLEFMMQM